MVLDFILAIIHSQVGTPQISIPNLGSPPGHSLLHSTQHPASHLCPTKDQTQWKLGNLSSFHTSCKLAIT